MTASRSYHHGDLRKAVIQAALEVIGTEGPSALSLRDLARRAGVSHAAPAHHFKDRAGLLTAIAVEGNELLTEALSQAEDIRDMGVRYVRFATEYPAHFQVMFQPDLVRWDDPELRTARGYTADRLSKGVAGFPEAGRGSDTELARVAAWSLAHGFATLLLSGALAGPVGLRDPGEAFRAVAGLLFKRPETSSS